MLSTTRSSSVPRSGREWCGAAAAGTEGPLWPGAAGRVDLQHLGSGGCSCRTGRETRCGYHRAALRRVVEGDAAGGQLFIARLAVVGLEEERVGPTPGVCVAPWPGGVWIELTRLGHVDDGWAEAGEPGAYGASRSGGGSAVYRCRVGD
jgi:hypothetical protein